MRRMENLEVEKELVKKATAKGVPINGTFELTPLCNMKCRMCYARLEPERVAAEGGLKNAAEWLKAAGEAAEAGALFVLLTGGEPLLHPGFREIYLGLLELGMIVSVNTNGTLIDEPWADFFAAHRPRRINVTLYGASADTYEAVCGYGDGFEKALRGIRLLLERSVDVKINGSLIRENVGDYDKLRGIAQELGAYMKIDSYMFPGSRDDGHDRIVDARLTPKEQGYYQYLERQYSDHYQTYLGLADTAWESWEKKDLESATELRPVECRAGRSSYFLDYRMRMLPCIFLKDAAWEMKSDNDDGKVSGFWGAWRACRDWTDALKLYAGCGACPGRKLCNVCAAALYTENGGYQEQPKYLCECTGHYIQCLYREGKKG